MGVGTAKKDLLRCATRQAILENIANQPARVERIHRDEHDRIGVLRGSQRDDIHLDWFGHAVGHLPSCEATECRVMCRRNVNRQRECLHWVRSFLIARRASAFYSKTGRHVSDVMIVRLADTLGANEWMENCLRAPYENKIRRLDPEAAR